MTRDGAIRIGLVAIVIAAGYPLKKQFPAAFSGIGYWSDRVTPGVVRTVLIVAAVILAIGIGVLLWDRFIRSRHKHSYHAQMGRWLSSVMIGVLLAIAVVLAVGAVIGSRVIVMSIGIFTIGFAIWLVGGLIAEAIKAWRKKRA